MSIKHFPKFENLGILYQFPIIYLSVILTCALMTQVKEFKVKIKNKFYIKSIIFTTLKTLNA